MRSIKPKSPNGYSIFCDDIRQEASGKLFIIGMYTGELILKNETPATLTKFAILINYRERRGESNDPVRLVIFVPGDEKNSPTYSMELPIQEERDKEPDPAFAGEDLFVSATTNVIIAPFRIEQEGWIRVRAHRGKNEYKLGSLRVRQDPPVAE